ncbi:MAG: dienelactone hydrolase family protein [Burkholderiales bacterium]|nr:dienelactone hydrolase family protein [Burkholderiales bacterium]
MSKLETKIVLNKPNEKPIGAVIWLHGLGADYNDFVPVVNELQLPIGLKFVFPNAPVIPVTINNGYKMRAWYDILDFSDLHREVDSDGIIGSVRQINELIEELIAEGFTSEQIIIAGFSQGGVISYYSALTSNYKLGGLMVLSSYLPDISLLDAAQIQHKSSLPILVCHGANDPVVNIKMAHIATKHLQQFNLKYEWHEYPMEHSICYEEIVAIQQWLLQIFAK